jgi:hypothetical protein|tara:strand:+ start:581 stop:1372 length:792 start_codon:yes stop_codon:yes gene_type:complete
MSNKKALLAENTIRRFMKLANVGGLADNTVDQLREEFELEAEEEEVEELPPPEEPDLGPDLGAEEEIEDVSLDIDEPADDDGIEIIGEKFKEFLRDNDVEIEVEGADAAPIGDAPLPELPVDEPELGAEEEIGVEEEEGEDIALAEARRPRRRVREGADVNDGLSADDDDDDGDTSYGHMKEDSGAEEGEHYERNVDHDRDHLDAIEDHVRSLRAEEGGLRHDMDYDEKHEALEENGASRKKFNESIVNEIAVRVARRLMDKS